MKRVVNVTCPTMRYACRKYLPSFLTVYQSSQQSLPESGRLKMSNTIFAINNCILAVSAFYCLTLARARRFYSSEGESLPERVNTYQRLELIKKLRDIQSGRQITVTPFILVN